MNFPFDEFIDLGANKQGNSDKVHYNEVLDFVAPLMTPERWAKIQKVAAARTFDCAVVLENIYDRGNASAVMRTAEALGFAPIHLIELGEKFKESQRTTAGADKWLELKKWKSTESCVESLKAQGFQIVATHLDQTSKPIDQIDFTKKTAFVLGNEKDGISNEMIKLADHRVILPMTGFVQSYNISVAAAIGLYHIYHERAKKPELCDQLSETQKKILMTQYCLRTQDSALDMFKARRK